MNRNIELEQFFTLYNQSNQNSSVLFLSLCSKIEAHHPGLLANILPLLKKIYDTGLLSLELEQRLTHRQPTDLDIFGDLIETLFLEQESEDIDELFEITQTPDEIHQLTKILAQKNIVNTNNIIQSLFYFLFCKPSQNNIFFLLELKDITPSTSETFMQATKHTDFKRHYESYLALIAISERYGQYPEIPQILANAHQPLMIAELLSHPEIGSFFQTSEALKQICDSHLPELNILLIYLEKIAKVPKPFVLQTLQQLTNKEQISFGLIQLQKALIHLFEMKKLETFEHYHLFWLNVENAFIFSKIYKLLVSQDQVIHFEKLVDACKWINTEKLLEILVHFKSINMNLEDQLWFFQQPLFLEHLDDNLKSFSHLYTHQVLLCDLGEENFVRLIGYRCAIINEMLVFFKQQGLLNPAFCTLTLEHRFINHLREHEIFSLLLDIPIHELYNYLLYHFSPNDLKKGFETLILLNEHDLLETENWANHLSLIRLIPDFQIHVSELFQLAENKQLNPKTLETFVLRFIPQHGFFQPVLSSHPEKLSIGLAQ
jgi:hypothetical protein